MAFRMVLTAAWRFSREHWYASMMGLIFMPGTVLLNLSACSASVT